MPLSAPLSAVILGASDSRPHGKRGKGIRRCERLVVRVRRSVLDGSSLGPASTRPTDAKGPDTVITLKVQSSLLALGTLQAAHGCLLLCLA